MSDDIEYRVEYVVQWRRPGDGRPVRQSDRLAVRAIVHADPSIDVVIVHHADGGNEFFSAKPEVERCERWRVIEICKGIIRTLEEMPRKQRSDAGSQRGCQFGGPTGPGCPSAAAVGGTE